MQKLPFALILAGLGLLAALIATNCGRGPGLVHLPGATTPLPSRAPITLKPVDDGEPDDCTEGETEVCYDGPASTMGVDGCHTGTTTCTEGVFGPCAGELVPNVAATAVVFVLENDNCAPLPQFQGAAEQLAVEYPQAQFGGIDTWPVPSWPMPPTLLSGPDFIPFIATQGVVLDAGCFPPEAEVALQLADAGIPWTQPRQLVFALTTDGGPTFAQMEKRLLSCE